MDQMLRMAHKQQLKIQNKNITFTQAVLSKLKNTENTIISQIEVTHYRDLLF